MSVPSQSYTNWLSLLNPSSPRRPRNETLSHLATLNNAQAPELSLDTLDTRDLLLPSGVKLRSYNSPSPSATILHIHGGGWGTGDLDSEDLYCRRLCNAGCTVYALEYTHSPWPAPLNNVHAALSHLSGIHEDLILSGTGNGASMVLSLLQRVGAAGVGGVILLTPWCLHPAFGAPQEPALDPLGLVDAAGAYKAYGAAPEEASPLLGEIGVGWPRTLVLLCTLDPAFWEGERLVDKIRGTGGEVKVLVKEGFPAGFWGWPRFEGAADMAGSVVEWVLGRKVEVGRAEGRERWGERKLCRVEGCGCWM